MKGLSTRGRTALGRGREAGFTAVEVALTSVVLAVALGGFISLLVSSARLAQVNWEITEAHNAARSLSETLQSLDPDEVYALYNSDPYDDPDGEGTAPGNNFEFGCDSLKKFNGSLMFGSIEFPAGPPEGDDEGYQALYPINIVVEWTGSKGKKKHVKSIKLKRTRKPDPTEAGDWGL